MIRGNDRVAIIGRSGSGKTTFATELAAFMVESFLLYAKTHFKAYPYWKLVAQDTKQAEEDQEKFRMIGRFTESPDDVFVRDHFGSVFRPPAHWPLELVKDACQHIYQLAYERTYATVFIDEYSMVVPSTRDAGEWLNMVFKRGRGRNVGVIGCTQEPVYVPRSLVSQANHIFLFDLHYPHDITFARDIFSDYDRTPDPHGFYYLNADTRDGWRYYADKSEFFGYAYSQ